MQGGQDADPCPDGFFRTISSITKVIITTMADMANIICTLLLIIYLNYLFFLIFFNSLPHVLLVADIVIALTRKQ